MQVLKKSYFTLIEMLVVLLILSTGLALTGVKVKQAFDEQRKLSDVQIVINALIMAQDLMLMMDTDVEVVFSHDQKTKLVTCQIFVEKLMDQAWSKVVEKPFKLSAIRSYSFTDSHQDPLRLRFTLGKMSQGILTLSTDPYITYGSNKKDDFKILLKGYPSTITKITNPDTYREYASVNEQLYPSEIYEDLHKNKNP